MTLIFKNLNRRILYGNRCLSSLPLRSDNDDRGDKNILPFEDIPAARRLPIFGTHLDFLAAGAAPQLHKYIDRRHHQLGPIFREKLGQHEAVFTSSPNFMRSIFMFEGKYPLHPFPDAWVLYNKEHNCQRGLFFMDGAEWLRNRKIVNKFLLSGNASWMDQGIQIATNDLIKRWRSIEPQGKNIFSEIPKLENSLYRWAIEVVVAIMLGKTYETSRPALESTVITLSENLHKIFTHSSKLMSFPPKIAKQFNMKLWTEFEQSVTEVLYLGNKIIDISLQQNKNSDGLLAMMQNSNIPTEDIKRIFVDFIIGAGDTTAFTTLWGLYRVALNKDIQNRVRQELHSGQNPKDLPFIRGIVRETLRIYPVAPFIGRFIATDAVIGNFKIHKGTLVLLSLYTSGRSENSFPDPLSFDPSRWLRKTTGELNCVGQAHGTLPFGLGSRSCIGKRIANAQIQYLMAQTLSNFELECLNNKPVDVILRMVAVPDSIIKIGIKKLV